MQQQYSSFIQWFVHPVPCKKQLHSNFLTLYTSGVYQDCIWLVGVTTDRVWPYMANRGEAYAALYSSFTLTLDDITVISVLLHSI